MSMFRSYLYVPAIDVARGAKALAGQADVVIFDLEDSIVPDRKDEARMSLAERLKSRPGRPVQIRVNTLASPWGRRDLEIARDLDVDAVRIPKVESAEDVSRAAQILGPEGPPIWALIESAIGVERAFEIASAPSVAGLCVGEADLSADLGVTAGPTLQWALARCVVAARAAGLPGPVQSVFTDLGDDQGLETSTRWGAENGFVGRSTIHPRQVEIVNRVLAPAAAMVSRAQHIIDSYAAAQRTGTGVAVTGDGAFIDAAVVASARQILAFSDLSQRKS